MKGLPTAGKATAPASAGAVPPLETGTGGYSADTNNATRAARGSVWRTLAGQLVRSPRAWIGGTIFAAIVLLSVLAPVFAHDIAHTNPFANNLDGTTIVNGHRVPLMQQGGGALHLGENPIGPTWSLGHYFLGADGLGRDVAARALYGGRDSLLIGIGSAMICTLIAVTVALVATAIGGVVDFGMARLMDLIWAFPVLLFAIALSTILLSTGGGIHLGPIRLSVSSLWLPTLIIAAIYVPYLYRPVRGHILSFREQDFVLAARAQGSGFAHLLFVELLPNVIPVALVLFPLLAAITIGTEAALSFLGVGVQAPGVSWGTMISDGESLLYTQPWVSLAPGILLVLTIIALNLLGEAVRSALDPRGAIRLRG